MAKIRVLVVDDAVVFRRLVADELNKDPNLEVVGTPPNGKIALARLPQVSPDIVILDVEMPEMDGLATLKEIRKTYPRLPVLMFSALTERGAEATLDALTFGATDYFTKPTNLGGLEASLEVIRSELIPQIKSLCKRGDASHTEPVPSLPRLGPVKTQLRPKPIEVVALATSTGGPNALAEVLAALPADFPVPIVIVQHMPPMFTRLLAERLSVHSRLHVHEAASGDVLQPGHAWIAPGNYHMMVVPDGLRHCLRIHQEPPENSCRPAADVLLRSVAQTFGPHSLTVIMTGMGQDGLRGCQALSAAGGQILVQDEATSVVWGMPGCVARAGLADRILPLALLADEVGRRVQRNR